MFEVNTDLISGSRSHLNWSSEQEKGDLLQPLHLCQDAGPRPAEIHNYHKSGRRRWGFSHDSPFHDSQAEKRFFLFRAGVLPTTTLNGGTLRTPDGLSQSALSDCITDVGALAKALLRSYYCVPNEDRGVCMCVQARGKKLLTKGFLLLCDSRFLISTLPLFKTWPYFYLKCTDVQFLFLSISTKLQFSRQTAKGEVRW